MNNKTIRKISVLLLSIYMPLMLSINFWHTDNWDLGKKETVVSTDSSSKLIHSSSDNCSVCSFFNSHFLAETTGFDFITVSSVSIEDSFDTVASASVSFASLRAPPTI